jgi:hypothetical protein
MSDTDYFVTSLINTPIFDKRISGCTCDNHTVYDLREREIVNVLYRRHSFSVNCHIFEWSLSKAFFSKPVHGQHRCMSAKPVATLR